jgi:NADH-quinone oxidoreductase subunit G
MDPVTLKIDGLDVSVPKGTTILKAALDRGIPIPFYCYHPGIGVEGSCRVCLVKVGTMPKLQTACSTVCTEGMVVDTKSPEVTLARASVFEFLLLNHPLDCPVCDKGGECPLQDYSAQFGPDDSRTEFRRRTFDGDGVAADVDFGPTLMLNRNRCILCTRCVRFMRDIDGDAQIAMIDRGNGTQLATFEERGVHSLLSGNLMDVCPVGAITTRDYRFKSRPWDNPLAVDTLCTSCSKGCNTTAWLKAKPEWAKGARLIRMTPRFNPDVNGYWMCDVGRFGYHWIENDTRLTTPLVMDPARVQVPASWVLAMARVRDGMAPVLRTHAAAARVIVSAHASLEELFLVRELVRRMQGTDAEQRVTVVWSASNKQQPTHTTFAVPTVDAPNVAGARDLGFVVDAANNGSTDLTSLHWAVQAGAVKVVYLLDPGPAGNLGDVSWLLEARQAGTIEFLVVQGVTWSPLAAAADVVLPGLCWAEKEALFTNDRGDVQATARVLDAPGEARDDGRILIDLATALGVPFEWTDTASVRSALGRDLAGKSSGDSVADIAFATPVAAGDWLRTSNPSERWKWDHLFHDNPPVKSEPPVVRAELVRTHATREP